MLKISFCLQVGFYSLLALTSGCSNLSGAAVKGVEASFGVGRPNLQSTDLKPGYVYLEVHSPGAQALVPLIFENTLPGQPPLDTWVANDGNVLRTQAGFLASTSGLPGYWQNVHYTFGADGWPTQVQFDIPSQRIFDAQIQFKNLGPVVKTYTPLMQRAAKAPNIVFNIWQGIWVNKPVGKALSVDLQHLQFIVGYNPVNRMPLYGLHCLQINYCVEYLLRTSAQNL